MHFIIRMENDTDVRSIHEVVRRAFWRDDKPDDFNEWKLIEDVRKSGDFIRELSLVAEVDGEVVGHILFTPMTIIDDDEKYGSLALAPVSVLPELQNNGIGTRLIEVGIEKAKEQGFASIIVMGHPKYYPKFGFELASKWSIGVEDDFESKYLFVLELKDGELDRIKGNVVYCDVFYNSNGELI